MFKRYPDIPCLFTGASFGQYAGEVVEAAKSNALNTKMVQGGNGLENFSIAMLSLFRKTV